MTGMRGKALRRRAGRGGRVGSVGRQRSACRGYTYLGLLFLLSLMALVAGSTASLWSLEARRERERELLFIGRQYRAAIEAYARAADLPAPPAAVQRPVRPTAVRNPRALIAGPALAASAAGISPAGSRPVAPEAYPSRLEDLLRDPRTPSVRRHLRRLYPDPLTGRADWVLLRNAQGRIVGLHSRSAARPIKAAGFDENETFGGAVSYQDWVFAPPGVAVVRTPLPADSP